jgi:hypothetical protein
MPSWNGFNWYVFAIYKVDYSQREHLFSNGKPTMNNTFWRFISAMMVEEVERWINSKNY